MVIYALRGDIKPLDHYTHSIDMHSCTEEKMVHGEDVMGADLPWPPSPFRWV